MDTPLRLDRPHQQELFEADDTLAAAVTRLLVSAERDVVAVDVHLAGARPTRKAQRPVVVGGEDGAAQPVDGVVGDPDGVVAAAVVVVREDAQDGFRKSPPA